MDTTEPTLHFNEVSIGGDNQWQLVSISDPAWSLKNGSVGDVYPTGCHLFILVHDDTGEILSKQCTLPEPDTQ